MRNKKNKKILLSNWHLNPLKKIYTWHEFDKRPIYGVWRTNTTDKSGEHGILR
jgi:hypothetical protein